MKAFGAGGGVGAGAGAGTTLTLNVMLPSAAVFAPETVTLGATSGNWKNNPLLTARFNSLASTIAANAFAVHDPKAP